MGQIKTILHVHSNYSHDSNISPAELVEQARREGVDCLGITDHDQIRGALDAQQIGGVRVIVGQEITTADGHLIGLFLNERIPPWLSVEESAARVKGQGGLVLAPHPFLTLCEFSLQSAVQRILPLIDAVEIHNAQNPLFWQDWKTRGFIRRHGLTAYSGADSHIRGFRWPAFQLMPDFDSPASFLAALQQARLVRGRYSPAYMSVMVFRHVYEARYGRPYGAFGKNCDPARFARAGQTSTRELQATLD
ncbi:MAG: PHP domain-containing protein [Phycisphaerae bacterium]